MKNTISAMICCLIFCSSFKNIKGYTIKGTATGFPDSTLLYLDDITDGSFRHIDSTYIIHEKFSFKGILKAKAVRTSIRTADFENRCYIWLENATIYFTGQKAKFREAFISGSKSQDDQYRLNALTKDVADSKEIEYAFAKNNPNTIVSAHLLSVYCSTWGKEKVTAVYNSFSAEVKNSYYGKNIAAFITYNKNVQIGDPAPDFSQNDINGKSTGPAAFKGKIMLLEFWGSWCRPCREANPELVKLYAEYNSKGFEVLGVGAETDKAQWLAAIKNDKLLWTNVTDLKGDKNRAALIYGVNGYPTNYLIDRNGIVIAKDLDSDKLREKLVELLK